VRIYYQSFLDPERHAPYFERLRAYLSDVAGQDTQIEVGGLSPPDQALSRLTEFRCSVMTVDNVIGAAESGCDAAVIGHFQDSGLYEARSAVDIPVLGLGESSMLYAGQLGRGFGLVTIDDVFSAWHKEQADRYGVSERLVGVGSMSAPPDVLVAALDDDEAYAKLRAAFEAAARPLVAAGAEVVIPAGGLFGLLAAREQNYTVDGAVVLNPVALVVKLARVAVELGLKPCRTGAFALAPPQAVDEFRALVRGGA
jgi:Asp/Glu/hydantoin racemase